MSVAARERAVHASSHSIPPTSSNRCPLCVVRYSARPMDAMLARRGWSNAGGMSDHARPARRILDETRQQSRRAAGSFYRPPDQAAREAISSRPGPTLTSARSFQNRGRPTRPMDAMLARRGWKNDGGMNDDAQPAHPLLDETRRQSRRAAGSFYRPTGQVSRAEARSRLLQI